MDAACIYKFERYETAFLDFEAATRKFHEGVLALALEGLANNPTLLALKHKLGIKHEHLAKCADRLITCA